MAPCFPDVNVRNGCPTRRLRDGGRAGAEVMRCPSAFLPIRSVLKL